MPAKALGEEGFRWFLGVVEDRDDPEKRGRVRVRVHGLHDSSEAVVPKATLPWAPVMLPATSSSQKQVGVSATGLQVGSTVFGFFVDGSETTMPIVMGSLPGKGDIPQLASEKPSINKQKVGPEPDSPYSAKYPYNKVMQTEAGHVIEIDDTPNAERIHVYHKSGTYIEIDQSGQRVNKIVGDDYEIVVKNKTVFIQGNLNIQVQGSVSLTAPNITINGDTTIKGKLTVTETITSQGNIEGNGVSLNTHVHGGVDPGSGTTSGPQ